MMARIGLEELLVLIVEPSPVQRRLIRAALNNNAVHSIIECDSGEAALGELATDAPDLVISSLYLPDMTGTQLVEKMRDEEATSAIPFMLISSETRIRYLDPVRQAGAVAILGKPFTDSQLHTALTTTLDWLVEDSDVFELSEDARDSRVLVVDDSTMSRRHISRVLALLGINNVDLAADGLEALDLIDRNYYDFVVTDYNMPRMDGRELVDYIRLESSQASIPVLMVTSESNENRLAAIAQSGVSAICDKPFEPAAVRALVAKMLAE